VPELVCAADDPRWLAERRRGITATDITAIAGLSPYQSPYGLWHEKTSPDAVREDNDRLRLGRELEPYIAQRWAEEYHIPPAHQAGAHSALYRSDERSWQLATPDRVFYDDPLELKSWADAGRHAWDDGLPPIVRAQVLWQMDTLGTGAGHVGVLFLPSGEFRSYQVQHEPWASGTGVPMPSCPFVQGSCYACKDQVFLREAGLEFYRRMTGELGPPGLDGSAATLAALKSRFPAQEGPAADIEPGVWNELAEARKARKEIGMALAYYEAVIREQAGTASRYKVNGQVAGWRVIADTEVKAHVRHQDYIRILGKDNDD